MEYKQLTIENYNEMLSAKKSTPGGGNTLALVLSFACSLCNMVINFTIDKKGYEHLNEKLLGFKETISKAQLRAYRYADMDSESFSSLMQAFKEGNKENIEKYSIEASMVPYNLYLLAERVHSIADELFVIGNKNVISDAKIASDLCYSIYPGCILNIKANIGNIKDQNVVNLLRSVIE